MELSEKIDFIKSTLSRKGWSGFSNLVRSNIALLKEPTFVGASPVFAQIEPTVECNLKCAMCISPTLEREVRMLTLERFKQITAQLPFLQKVSLVGVGEPLLNPELFEIIAFAKSKFINIGFATNGALLHENNRKSIVKSGLDWINVSIDGAKKETYEEIRKGANFEQFLDNIKELVKLTNILKKPKVSLWFLAMDKNIEELPEVVNLCATLGVKKLYVQTLQYWGSQSWKKKLENQRISVEGKTKNILSKVKKIAKEKDVIFDYVNIPDESSKRMCKWPWKTCYITTDGYITPCCIHGADPKIINFGNIFKEDFKEIWNNSSYKEFRKKLKSNKIPSICYDCPSYHQKVKI